MKKLLFFTLIFAFFLLHTPLVFADQDDSSYVTPSASSSSQEATESASADKAIEKQEINYELPYSGVLPDNPLYFLKTFRDKIVSFLINDPIKKAEFNLLNADKRMSAGLGLAKKKKTDLALTTISKGNNYFHQALSSAESAKKGGRDAKPVLERMQQALRKYAEVFDQMKQADPELQKGILQEEKRVSEFQKSVDSLINKK